MILMAEYIYDLSTDSRYHLGEYFRPLDSIPVIHGSEELCCADLSESGIVVMEVPGYISEELNANRARILAWSQVRPPREFGSETRSKEITHFEIVT